jgi:hypothetical protein
MVALGRQTFGAIFLVGCVLLGCESGGPAGPGDSTAQTANIAIDDEVGSVCVTKTDGRVRCWGRDGTIVGDLTLPDVRYSRVQDTGVGPIGLTDDGRLYGPRGAIPDDLPPIVDFRATNLWGRQGLCLKAQDRSLLWGNFAPDAVPPKALQADPGPFVDVSCAFEGLVCALRDDGTVLGPYCPQRDDWVQVSISVTMACGLTRSGDVVCTPGTRQTGVVPIFTGGPYKQIATAYQAACALDASDRLTCLRVDGTPVTVDPGPYTSIIAGRDLVCGIRRSGAPACFRQNEGAGSLDVAATFTAFGPVAPAIDDSW